MLVDISFSSLDLEKHGNTCTGTLCLYVSCIYGNKCMLSPVLLGVGVCRLPITVTTGPTGKVEGRWSDLHT